MRWLSLDLFILDVYIRYWNEEHGMGVLMW